MVDGTETDAFGLKKGMVVTAAKVVTTVTTQKAVVGTMPQDVPILIANPK